MSKARAYCFTVNNPTQTQINWPENVKYAIYQLEQGENGTRHLQGYLELDKPTRISAIKVYLPTAHLETRKGTREQAREYCKKNDTRIDGPWEHGLWNTSGQGRRTDIERLHELLKSNTNERDIRDKEFGLWTRHYRAIERYKLLDHAIERQWKTEVYVLIDEPGTGKSRWCMEQTKDAYWKQNSKWWCGYDGTSDVVLDDFYGWLPFSTLLNICDRYPCKVETKGGQVNFAAKKIFITSNVHWTSWYTNEKIDIRAFKRRVSYFVEIINGVAQINPNSS